MMAMARAIVTSMVVLVSWQANPALAGPPKTEQCYSSESVPGQSLCVRRGGGSRTIRLVVKLDRDRCIREFACTAKLETGEEAESDADAAGTAYPVDEYIAGTCDGCTVFVRIESDVGRYARVVARNCRKPPLCPVDTRVMKLQKKAREENRRSSR